MKINLLDKSIYNLISAGEVVQNPASIVKELCENSIDAGAKNISVYIRDGGIKEITIVDDGEGISYDDVSKAFLPHATSKISAAHDLNSLSTLGFRGEALASIASVSNVTVKTKYFDEEIATMLEIKGGEEVRKESTAFNKGTMITVNSLFYNTPARFKFLKNATSEERNVTSTIKDLILSNEFVSFKYYVDQQLRFNSGGQGLYDAITSVYSADIYDNIIEVNYSNKDISVKGFVSSPTTVKNSRNYFTTIINGRIIYDIGLNASIVNAYGDSLMKRCFPIVILDIILPFDFVDVNVHPCKREVRFSNPRQVYGTVYDAVKKALFYESDRVMEQYLKFKNEKINSTPNLNLSHSELPHSDSNAFVDNKVTDDTESKCDADVNAVLSTKIGDKTASQLKMDGILSSLKSSIADEPLDLSLNGLYATNSFMKSDFKENLVIAENSSRDGDKGNNYIDDKDNILKNRVQIISQSKSSDMELVKKMKDYTPLITPNFVKTNHVLNQCMDNGKMDSSDFKNLPQNDDKSACHNQFSFLSKSELLPEPQIIGQLFGTYILIEHDDNLYLIDQHAFDEKINYDEMVKNFNFENITKQTLILPIIFEHAEIELLLSNSVLFDSLGFQIEKKNDSIMYIHTIPAFLNKFDIYKCTNEFFVDCIDVLLSHGKIDKLHLFKDKLMQKACKNSIKGGDKLNSISIGIMLDKLKSNSFPTQCPHGRPTYLKYPKTEFEKMFRRKL